MKGWLITFLIWIAFCAIGLFVIAAAWWAHI